jgi:hypothetical protein
MLEGDVNHMRTSLAMAHPSFDTHTIESQHGSVKTLPTPAYTARASDALAKNDRELLRQYFVKLGQICAAAGRNPTRITVDLFNDVEEEARSVVVTSYFDVDAPTALAYWDTIAQELGRWAECAIEDRAADVLDLISTSVRWRD